MAEKRSSSSGLGVARASSAFGRHAPFYCGLVAGLAGGALGVWLRPDIAFVLAANAYFLTYLGMTLAKLPRLSAAYLKGHAASTDMPVWIIFTITAVAIAVTVGSLFLLVNSQHAPEVLTLSLTLAAVLFGWLTIHLMAAIHYAHLYWQPHHSEVRGKHAGGLEFPGTPDPQGTDFVYFAFVIGMTAQTSDVAITTQGMRKINTVHAIVSFFFNTVLVAAAVNVAVSVGQ